MKLSFSLHTAMLLSFILLMGCGGTTTPSSPEPPTKKDEKIPNKQTPVNKAPVIFGTAKKEAALYDIYTFAPKAFDEDDDQLTFTIENRPSWADFNTTNGLLCGVVEHNSTNKNIIISVSDGKHTTTLKPFDIKVKEAKDIAHLYGKATQTPSTSYYFKSASAAIDNNDSTNTETFMHNDIVWWQVALPATTKIRKIRIQPIHTWYRDLGNAKVYISNVPYNDSLDETHLITTLKGGMDEQILTYPKGKEASYLIIRRDSKRESAHQDTILDIASVEVYGTIPSSPTLKKRDYNTTIHRWYNKVEPLLKINALDYQDDKLNYKILEPVPFTIDSQGNIRVKDILEQNQYYFKVLVDDGVDTIVASIMLEIEDKAKANQHIYTSDATPNLKGYLPNTYHDGDNISIMFDKQHYTPVIHDDGTWSIDGDEIESRLAIGDYNLSISINHDSPILYRNFFKIYGKSTYAQKVSLRPSLIVEDIDVAVISSDTHPLPRGKKVRATSMWLTQEDGKIRFINDSYRKMKSIIVKQKDSQSEMQFKKLTFSQSIKPYSSTILDAFTDVDKMEIFYTAGQFDKEISFAGDDRICSESMRDKRAECSPTNKDETPYSDTAVKNSAHSEQEVFTQVEATWHHIYNRLDGLKSIDAWIDRKFYKGMDFTTDYQSSDDYAQGEGKREFFTKSFFAAFLPNNHTEYYVMRYHYTSMGLAGMPNQIASFDENVTIGSWASLWDGATKLGKEMNRYTNKLDFRILPFEYIHHEEMHSNGMGHETGLTYGWPHHAAKKFIKKYYTPEHIEDADSAIFPEVHAPKYLFMTEVLTSNSVKLTVYQTGDASSKNLTFEIFSNGMRADDFQFESIDENSVKLTFDESIYPRFFIRLYGQDSDEIMSKLITPALMHNISTN